MSVCYKMFFSQVCFVVVSCEASGRGYLMVVIVGHSVLSQANNKLHLIEVDCISWLFNMPSLLNRHHE